MARKREYDYSEFERAFEKYDEKYFNSLPWDEIEKIEFSDEFESKMDKLVARESKPRYRLFDTPFKKSLVLVAALVAALALSATSVATTGAVTEFYIRFHDSLSDVYGMRHDAPIDASLDFDFNTAKPTYIPQGFTLESEDEYSTMYIANYKNGNKLLSYMQQSKEIAKFAVDTEDAEYETGEINGHDAFFISKTYTDSTAINSIVFCDSKYIYFIAAEGVSTDEVRKMAESVKSDAE